MLRTIVVLMLTLAGCAAQSTQMEACPASGCGPAKASPSTDSQPTRTLMRQAAFDLQCDEGQLRWSAIGEESTTTDVRSWGVRGCGKQATYMLEPRCGGYAGETCSWILNSPVQASP